MASKFIITAAVPFHTARLQANLNRNLVRKVTEVEKHVTKEKDINSKRPRKRMENITAAEKLHLRRLRNRAAAQSSREKAKQEENLLKQRVNHLKYEKMKILLENEALRQQNEELEVENESLKSKAQSLHSQTVDKGNDVEAAFKHALFVNIPLQKDWVLPKVFFLLMMAMWESVKQNTFTLNYWRPHVQMSLKHLFSLMCLPWKLMLPLAGYQYSPTMILNG